MLYKVKSPPLSLEAFQVTILFKEHLKLSFQLRSVLNPLERLLWCNMFLLSDRIIFHYE